MVLWELTVATAYFLGLKRTYRLALKIQRRLIGPNHPKARQFLHSRTRAVFDMAVSVHRNIQQRDIEVGRNLGNWILRWLDKMKPAAQIRGGNCPNSGNTKTTTMKQLTNSSHQKMTGSSPTMGSRNGERQSDRHLFTSSRNMWPKAFPTIAVMMQPKKPVGTSTPYRYFSASSPFEMKPERFGFSGVYRKDIMQWLQQS